MATRSLTFESGHRAALWSLALASALDPPVLEQPLQSGAVKASITVFSVVLSIFGRMRREVQWSGTIGSCRERYESGLGDCSADFERSWIDLHLCRQRLRRQLGVVLCACRFDASFRAVARTMSRPYLSWRSFDGELDHAPVEDRSFLDGRRVRWAQGIPTLLCIPAAQSYSGKRLTSRPDL